MGTNIAEVTGGKLYCLDEHGNQIDILIDFMGIPNITVSREYTGEMESKNRRSCIQPRISRRRR